MWSVQTQRTQRCDHTNFVLGEQKPADYKVNKSLYFIGMNSTLKNTKIILYDVIYIHTQNLPEYKSFFII